MDNFAITISEQRMLENGKLYVSFLPVNPELMDKVGHSMTLATGVTPAMYAPTAAKEMFTQIDKMFPNMYQLDPKYL